MAEKLEKRAQRANGCGMLARRYIKWSKNALADGRPSHALFLVQRAFTFLRQGFEELDDG